MKANTMILKRIILIFVGLIVVIGLTVGILILIKPPAPLAQGTETARGIKPTNNFVFNNISGLSSSPIFGTTPNEQNGWVKVAPNDTTGLIVQMTNTNSCSFTAQSQQIPYTNNTLKDYDLSKSYAATITATEQGTLSDEYIIKIKTSKGDADFYSGVYSPKINLTHPQGTTPTTQGGSVAVSSPYTTFIAVRSIANPLKTSSSGSTASTSRNYKPGEIVTIGDMIPTIVLKYSCKTSVFDVMSALNFVKKVQLDLNPTAASQTNAATTGK